MSEMSLYQFSNILVAFNSVSLKSISFITWIKHTLNTITLLVTYFQNTVQNFNQTLLYCFKTWTLFFKLLSLRINIGKKLLIYKVKLKSLQQFILYVIIIGTKLNKKKSVGILNYNFLSIKVIQGKRNILSTVSALL